MRFMLHNEKNIISLDQFKSFSLQNIGFKFICQVKDTNASWSKTSNPHVHLPALPTNLLNHSLHAPGYLACQWEGLI